MTSIVTLEQLEMAAVTALDFYSNKGDLAWQNDQERPLLRDLMAMEKPFPGGKEHIIEHVVGEYVTTIEGFQYDDTVGYGNPAKIRQAYFPWKLIHAGINVTKHELLKNGISIVEGSGGDSTKKISRATAIQLQDIFEYKIEDMQKGMAKDFDEMFWGDGSSDPLLVPGIRSIIVNDPTAAITVGGIDQSANAKWRNYASLSINAGTPANQEIVKAMKTGLRQMRRYGSPKHKVYAGADFLDALENELLAKGNYTETGWADRGRIDAGVADVKFKGVNIDYAPTLDDLGLAKYCFWIDMSKIRCRPIEGESMQDHSPERPHNKYVLYKGRTWAGGLSCRQRNTSGVFSIA